MSTEQPKHPDIVICPTCNCHKVKTLLKRRKGRDIWIDARGKRWYGKKCPDCYLKYKLEYDKERRVKQGFKVIGQVNNCRVCNAPYVLRKGSKHVCPKCNADLLNKALGR